MRRAVVVGRSRDALVEYESAAAMCVFDYVIVVGEMALHFPQRIDHWVSWHAEAFPHWERKIREAGREPPRELWSAIYKGRKMGARLPIADRLRYVQCVGGSSGFLGAQVALDGLGCDIVVLAGVPMDGAAAHHGDERPWEDADKLWAAWEEHEDYLRGRVRSMSGRTRDLLGYPDKEWLDGQH